MNMEKAGAERRPFDGVRILDLTHVLAGPFCTYQLALLGAETIKIERPGDHDIVRDCGPDKTLNADGMGASFLAQNSNKKCITLDLKSEKGRGILKKLVLEADVLVENYRVGALADLGLGSRDLLALNPKLIYCSMTGFGSDGPKATHNAYDQVIQAMSGLMSMNGLPGSIPLRAGGPIVDYTAGLCAAFAVSSALYLRAQTGRGQHVDCAMFDSAMMLICSVLTGFFRTGRVPAARGNDLDQAGVSGFETRGGVLMLGCFNARQNRRFWNAVGRPDLARYGSIKLQEQHRDELDKAFKEVLRTRTAADWETFFNDIGVPAGRARNLKEALEIEQIAYRNLFHTFAAIPGVEGPVTVPVAPFKFEHGGPRVDTAPRRLGADNLEVLRSIGIDADQARTLAAEGVI